MFVIRSTQPDDQPFQWDMAQALGCIIHQVPPFHAIQPAGPHLRQRDPQALRGQSSTTLIDVTV